MRIISRAQDVKFRSLLQSRNPPDQRPVAKRTQSRGGQQRPTKVRDDKPQNCKGTGHHTAFTVARPRRRGDRVKRRDFITLLGGAAARPLKAGAQQSHRVPRIGVLLLGTPTSFAPRTQAFVEGLRDLGYVEGRTVAIEWKWGQDRVDQLPDLAAELVTSQVDVIVTGGTPPARALKNATRTIPIVMAIVGD